MKKSDKVWPRSVATGAFGAIVALTLAAPPAQADPEIPIPPPPPPDEQSISVQAAPAPDPAPPAEVPHLSSPENLPPGTTDVPTEPQQGAGVSYLRDLWHAVQTQNISGRDALLLLTQRPLDAHAVPTNGLPAGPQAPLAEAAPPAPLPRLAHRRRCRGWPTGARCPRLHHRHRCPRLHHRHRCPRLPHRRRCPSSCPLRLRRRHKPQTVAASLSSSSLFVASRYS